MSKHTSWVAYADPYKAWIKAGDKFICQMSADPERRMGEASRIVECVNALEGVKRPTVDLPHVKHCLKKIMASSASGQVKALAEEALDCLAALEVK